MNAAIFLRDTINTKWRQPVENFEFDIDKDALKTVKARLLELQKGYCEKGDAKPKIALGEATTNTGKKVKFITATSEVDFFYVAYLAQKIKPEFLPQSNDTKA